MFAISMQHILYHCNTYNINANINVHILSLDECIRTYRRTSTLHRHTELIKSKMNTLHAYVVLHRV